MQKHLEYNNIHAKLYICLTTLNFLLFFKIQNSTFLFLIVASYLTRSVNIHQKLMALVNDCRSLLHSIPNAQVHHVFIEANRITDTLASLGCSLIHDLIIFLVPQILLGTVLFCIIRQRLALVLYLLLLIASVFTKKEWI